jgi:hypothetical protein
MALGGLCPNSVPHQTSLKASLLLKHLCLLKFTHLSAEAAEGKGGI